MRNHRFGGALGDAQVRVAILAAVALMVQAVIAKEVLEVELDFVSQFAALWVFIVFQVSGERSRAAELGAAAAIVLVTAAILLLYAL
jgi:hypothetical protein